MVEMMEIQKVTKKGTLTLSPITVDSEYRKKWDIDMDNFVVLTRDGELVRPTLYRVGGVGPREIESERFFMLIKYVEALYSPEIIKMAGGGRREHLNGVMCILDQDGNELVVQDGIKSLYLTHNSCICSHGGEYMNIITGQKYGSGSKMESSDFIFIGKDFSKGIVYKVNKVTGETETFN